MFGPYLAWQLILPNYLSIYSLVNLGTINWKRQPIGHVDGFVKRPFHAWISIFFVAFSIGIQLSLFIKLKNTR